MFLFFAHRGADWFGAGRGDERTVLFNTAAMQKYLDRPPAAIRTLDDPRRVDFNALD